MANVKLAPRMTRMQLMRATEPGRLAEELNAAMYSAITEGDYYRIHFDRTAQKREPEKLVHDIRDYLEAEAGRQLDEALRS